MNATMDVLSRVAFAIGAVILMLLSLGLSFYGVGALIAAIGSSWDDVSDAALAAIGYVVISLATFDVAKYFIEEEVIRGREMRVAAEARRSLTKFISTIVIALFIEGLVTVFRVSKSNVEQMLYPTALLFTAIVIVVGLGLFQKLSAEVEPKVEERDRTNSREDRKRAKTPAA